MKFNILKNFSDKDQAGFTLIEMAVVAAIIGLVSTAIITSFPRNRVNLVQSANVFVSATRIAQTYAVSSTRYNSYNPCGYGVHYIDTTHFSIYVGPNAAENNCSVLDRNYQAGEDVILTYQSFGDAKVQFMSSFNDVFFEPPDPKTYLNNDSSLNQTPLGINIGVVGGTCPADCKTINIYPSGNIEIQ